MKRLAGCSVLALVLGSTSGCSWLWGEKGYFRDRGSDYLTARQTAPMRLPADVEVKHLDPLLPIPQQIRDSDVQGQFEVPRPQPLVVSEGVSDFSRQNSGDSSWLFAQRVPAEVWPGVRQFFEDGGFGIRDERAQTGEFNTDWQPLERLSSGLKSKLSGSVAGLAEGTQVRVHVRLEPGVQRNTTEVFVVTAQRPAGSSVEVPFTERSLNKALDSALLDELQASLASGVEQGGSVSLLAGRDYDAPDRVTLSVDGAGNPVLNLSTDFDRAWSGVGRSLRLSDLRVEDINRSLALYYVNLAEGPQRDNKKPGFFRRLFGGSDSKEDLEARAERYQVRLTAVGDSVQVTVEKDINTVAPAEVSRRVLGMIQENLG
jgi:outer membrane protein assembly factor BamC